ncbi:MAG: bifunctional phosphoribosylaminoimidazolecarboxamide formyltransferase/IMP cyclohydrolase [Chloroflexi bacterium]|nr:bifunctional phosphoribosylaminoimidazolecarboxamide formyltransferase/IMP cyclohydrolase [Chloroflexota bacterium]
MRAILSVHNKSGLIPLAQGLAALSIEMFSTGGTKKALSDAGVPVHSISDITGFPEILDGRVKTLHPAVHGGILARRDIARHREELAQQKIQPIDLVVVNLYPFRETVARSGVTLDEALENIDIGGPTMLRASAKNFPHVLVVVDPSDYGPILEQLRQGSVRLEERRRLAQKAFQHVACYDTAISQYLRNAEEGFPPDMTIALEKQYDLRYGENPHQQAAFYREVNPLARPAVTVGGARLLSGPELSFNNILDLDSALAVVSDFSAPTVAIIKHNNSCGMASHDNLAEAYRRALSGDPVAAFGGVVALNRNVDMGTAQEIDRTHYDCLLAPDFDPNALALLSRKKGMRILALGGVPPPRDASMWDLRRVAGGLLVQTPDTIRSEELTPKTVTRRPPTPSEMEDLLFAWRAVKHIKSNAIVLAKDKTLLGMGAGQPSRVISVEIAVKKAGDRARGSVLAGDAFFPFPDGVDLAGQAGVTAIMEPGGSVKDQEVIQIADRYNIAMVFSGARHFKH